MRSSHNSTVKDLLPVIAAGLLIRLALIMYVSTKEDIMNQEISLTDIDYKVYSDAATPDCANPYLCHHTYRYSPLLGYLMGWNQQMEVAGKIAFVLFDALAMVGLALLTRAGYEKSVVQLYSYNPLFIYLTVRGSCESISLALMFWTFYLLFGREGNSILALPGNKAKCTLHPRMMLGYLLYGLWVHFRVYPIILLPIILIHLYKATPNNFKLFVVEAAKMALLSGGTFLLLLALFYSYYGWVFIEQTYLYHLRRLDNRHSFSPVFYDIYLSMNSQSFLRSLAQICVLFTATRRVHSSLSPAASIFIATYAFVSFNKVITLQYYMWVWGALLFLLPESTLLNNASRRYQKAFSYVMQWVLGVLVWVWMSLKLERDGDNIFMGMWVICICKLFLDLWVLTGFLKTLRSIQSYEQLPSKSS